MRLNYGCHKFLLTPTGVGYHHHQHEKRFRPAEFAMHGLVVRELGWEANSRRAQTDKITFPHKEPKIT